MDAFNRVSSDQCLPAESVDQAAAEWRRGNRQRVIDTVRRLLNERSVEPVGMPDVVFPLLDECANTSDERLSDLFARLLANHLARIFHPRPVLARNRAS